MKTDVLLSEYFSLNEVLRISNFILSYEKEDGGFSFSKYTPATREDTYYAVKSLNLIDYQYKGEKVLSYIIQLLSKHIMNHRNFYQLLYLIHTYDFKPQRKLMVSLIKRSERQYHNLSDLYYYVLIMNTLNLPLPKTVYEIIMEYPAGSLRNLPNTAKYLILLSSLNISFDEDYYLTYLKCCQSGDGGYGFLPGSTSFLENVCYALRAHNCLQSPPDHMDRILAFIQRCQGRRGGFGRKDVTLPTIRSTCHALESLTLLRTFSSL
ncbi:MAG: hypothetical protein ACFFFH_07555 [Candidatus Thorarchaeota archaeon]